LNNETNRSKTKRQISRLDGNPRSRNDWQATTIPLQVSMRK
jgi:hypothetical protein